MTAPRFAKPDAWTSTEFAPGWHIEFDGPPIAQMFGERHIVADGVITSPEGKRYRAHFWASRAGFPLRTDSVMLNYLGKRAGAPVAANHIPAAWNLARLAWHDACLAIRETLAAPAADTEAQADADAKAAEITRQPLKLSGTVRRDNVEYHAGSKAKADGEPESACPYLAGGDRAARWTLGWQEGSAAPAAVASAMLAGQPETIDMTPTWEGILPALLAAVTDGTITGKQIAREELTRMAQIADRYVAAQKALAES